jgi:periplasmic mercuric ion binding protein
VRCLRVLTSVLMLTVTPASGAATQTVVLDVQNMTCALCPITVQKSLEQVPGVASAKIDLDKKTATVQFDPDKAEPAALVKATTNAGFPSAVHK